METGNNPQVRLRYRQGALRQGPDRNTGAREVRLQKTSYVFEEPESAGGGAKALYFNLRRTAIPIRAS